MFNFNILIYGFVCMFLTLVILWLVTIGITMSTKKHIDKKTLKKETNKVFSFLYAIVIIGWLIFIIINFAMNPITHNNKQKSIGTDILLEEAITQSEIDMITVKKEGVEEIKEKDQKRSQKLKEVKKQSSEDYNNFLKSIK